MHEYKIAGRAKIKFKNAVLFERGKEILKPYGRIPFEDESKLLIGIDYLPTELHDKLAVIAEVIPDNGYPPETPPGMELYRYPPQNLREFKRHYGSGQNALRTRTSCQPNALQVGDVLMTGDRVLSLPREGGNGRVLVHLTGGTAGHWIDIASRVPIAMKKCPLKRSPRWVMKYRKAQKEINISKNPCAEIILPRIPEECQIGKPKLLPAPESK